MAFSSSPAGHQPDSHSPVPERWADEPLSEEARLLDSVLQQTRAALESGQAVGDADAEALRAVARRFAGYELTLEPVTVQLVAALLTTRFRSLDYSPSLWQQPAREIAQTLWEDPPSRARLAALWAFLVEAER